MKCNVWITILMGLAMVVATPQVLAQISGTPGFTCDIAGAWVGSSPAIPNFYPNTMIVTTTITSTDPTGKKLVGVLQPANVDTASPPYFADPDRTPDTVATYVRTSPRTYQFTWIAYYVKSAPPFHRGQMLTFFTYSGTAECLDANTVVLSGVISNWSSVDRPEYGLHNQDKDEDGLPDAGETPYSTLSPFGFTLKRLPLMAP